MTTPLCHNTEDRDLFFADDHGRYPNLRRAKQLCAACPLRTACLQAGKGEYGIWGGTTEEERITLRAQLPEPPPFRRSYGEPTPQTHCRIGHELRGSNIITNRPGRVCKTCFDASRERDRVNKAARRREAKAAAKEQAA
jgi:hypothetical protein